MIGDAYKTLNGAHIRPIQNANIAIFSTQLPNCHFGHNQRSTGTEITHDPLIFSVAQGIFWLSTERLSRSTYITF